MQNTKHHHHQKHNLPLIHPKEIIKQHSPIKHTGMLTLFFLHLLKKRIRTKSFGLFIVSLLFAILILVFSVTQTQTIALGVQNSGVISHLISYFILSFLIAMYFKEKHARFGKGWMHFINGIIKFKEEHLVHIILKSAIIAGSYGIFIEIIQFYVPYRHFQFIDILVNFTGAFLIFAILPLLIRHE